MSGSADSVRSRSPNLGCIACKEGHLRRNRESRNTLLKALGKLERDRAGGPTTASRPSGQGQREKRPPAPYSPGGITSDNDECVPMKRKKKERESFSNGIPCRSGKVLWRFSK
ncbi:hypothetical protein AALO_G00203110 [Alosa alosa]|uniref:Uncharacterized protein n=1 Tax=Alosa alosa TaxID=278164 RepID=A0AAV6G6L4_9TELE|nr:hypothetical protein AALO_G00203110 [Alosa alosa]